MLEVPKQTCITCGEFKPIGHFYIKGGGRPAGECKKCTIERSVRNQLKRPFATAETAHRSYMKHKERYNARAASPEVLALARDKYQIDKKDKVKQTRWRCRNLTRRAIRNGVLIKHPCEVCSTTDNVQAHHDDYSKPYEVKWLCREHHGELHRDLTALHKFNMQSN